ncbi:MAG: B12-binding domain-containing radical SAM protein, partial [Proteobacteria bacterium]|nr:B12-binding domain-containing radical SAM protein [Pseudomonadota bacterium]
MKILLVNPSIPHRFRMLDYADELGQSEISKRVLVGPPLGLNDIAGMLGKEEVKILDQKAEIENNPDYDVEEGIIDEIRAFNPDIVGFTCLAAQFNTLKRVLKSVKKYNRKLLVVIGGIHATSCPDDFHDHNVDIMVLGLGKVTFYNIIQAYKKNRDNPDFSHIHGIGIKNGNGFTYTKSLNLLSYKEFCDTHFKHEIPPNRDLTDHYDYRHPQTQMKIQYLSTSMGCTHRCNFCFLWRMTHGRYMYRDAATIIDELKTMGKYELIRFCDAHTFGNIEKAKHLFTLISEGSFNHLFMADIRADTVVKHPDIVKLASKAGVKLMIMGLEATSDEELKEYGKNSTIQDTIDAIKIINESGIYGIGNYIVRPDFDEKDF